MNESEHLQDLIDALRAKGLTISDRVSTMRELVIAVESARGEFQGGDIDLDDQQIPIDMSATRGPDDEERRRREGSINRRLGPGLRAAFHRAGIY